jgi:hypothetical protein
MNLELADTLITLAKLPKNHKYLLVENPSKATIFSLRRMKFKIARLKKSKYFEIRTKK